MNGEAEATHGSFVCSGVRIDSVGPRAAVDLLLQSRYGRARRVHLCNSYTLAVALRDPAYRRLLNESDHNFADGHYVAMVGRWRGQGAMDQRVYGPALMLATLDQGRAAGLRHYLYGTTEQTVARLAATLAGRFPGLRLVGVEAPPFRPLTPLEEDALIQRIQRARPDILWVGLGTPRQDEFVARYAVRLGCTVVPVGAAFDFHSGTKRTAPRFMQRVGMEWLFRFANEPVRLWRRYLIGIPVFMYGVATDRWRRPDLPAPVVPAQTPLTLDPVSLMDPAAEVGLQVEAGLPAEVEAAAGVVAASGLNGAHPAPPDPLLPLPRTLEIEFPLRPAAAGEPEESRRP